MSIATMGSDAWYAVPAIYRWPDMTVIPDMPITEGAAGPDGVLPMFRSAEAARAWAGANVLLLRFDSPGQVGGDDGEGADDGE